MIDVGVGRDVPVGICLERSFDYIIAMLAASRAGGAFLPLDPGWPVDRLRFILDDAHAPVLVTSSNHGLHQLLRDQGAIGQRGAAPPADERWTILLPEAKARPQNGRRSQPRKSVGPTDLAYIIYTSGRPESRRVSRSPTPIFSVS